MNSPQRYIDPDGEEWVENTGKDKAEKPWIWVDKCPKKQTCYEIVVTRNSNSLTIYQKNGGTSTYYANEHGQIDLRELAMNDDAYFEVANDQRVPEEWVGIQAASALFVAAYNYHSVYTSDDKLVVTAANLSNGKPCVHKSGKKCHSGHRGNALDIRYMNSDGNAVKAGDSSYSLADVERMKKLIDLFSKSGFNTVFTGYNPKFGLPRPAKNTKGNENVHKNHIHFNN
ncbi:MAG: hypothetical protein R2684_04550 [Pyrinomonadaceae bacterium]